MAISICNTTTDESGRELVTHGTTQFPLACYHDDLLLEPVPWHWHEELEAVVISEGEAVIIIENEKYTLTKGNGYFTNTNALHAAYLETQETCKFHSLVFHPRLVAGNLDSIYWQKYMEPILQNNALKGLFLDQTIDWHKEILISIEQAWQACVSETPGFEFLVRNELSKLIFLLQKNTLTLLPPLSKKRYRDSERIKVMLQYIHNNYFEQLSIAMIAQSASISESECLRCFHKTINTTPIQYLKEYRLLQATTLLHSSTDSISEIASKCGFHEMSYFSKSFRTLIGCSPSEYRSK